MYFFERKYVHFPFYGIFLKEDLRKGLFSRNKNALVAIYEINVTDYQYNKIKEKIYLDNKKALFKPEELTEDKGFNKIFEGKIRDYIAIY